MAACWPARARGTGRLLVVVSEPEYPHVSTSRRPAERGRAGPSSPDRRGPATRQRHRTTARSRVRVPPRRSPEDGMRDRTTAGPSPSSGWMRTCSPWSSSATSPPWDRANRADRPSSETWRRWSDRPPTQSSGSTRGGWSRPARGAVRPLVDEGVRVQRCWDVAEVHRLLHGGWRADLARVWASAYGLDPDGAPEAGRGRPVRPPRRRLGRWWGRSRPGCRRAPRRLPAPGRPRPEPGRRRRPGSGPSPPP